MNRENERMLEALNASYRTAAAKRVCADCFSDPYIQDFIRTRADSGCCDYCEAEAQDGGFNSAPANALLEYIESCVLKMYEGAENRAMSGDPSGLEAHDLINELGLLSDPDSSFREELELLLGRDEGKEWLAYDHYDGISPHDAYVKSWEEFKVLVKQKSRFVFGQIVRDTSGMDYWEQQVDPYSILKWLHGMVSAFGLICELPVGTEMIRVRADDDAYFSTMDELGSAPIRLANYANRMSPAGIPMFYAAEDAVTAIKEVWNGKVGVKLSAAAFKTKKPCLILDFCNLPPILTIFKRDATLEQIEALSFLWSFVRDISQPVSKSEKEPVEYVPTQILTEYFRHIFKTKDGRPIMGLKYPSSYTGRPCYVMFWGHNENSEINPEVIEKWCDLSMIQHRTVLSKISPRPSLIKNPTDDSFAPEPEIDQLIYKLTQSEITIVEGPL